MKRLILILIIYLPLAARENTKIPDPAPNPKFRTVKNCIEPRMLKYWSYTPEIFTLKVNGQPLKPGAFLQVPLEKNTMVVRYDYSFANGFRKGAKEVTFEVDSAKNECDLKFSWDDESRVILLGQNLKKSKDSNLIAKEQDRFLIKNGL